MGYCFFTSNCCGDEIFTSADVLSPLKISTTPLMSAAVVVAGRRSCLYNGTQIASFSHYFLKKRSVPKYTLLHNGWYNHHNYLHRGFSLFSSSSLRSFTQLTSQRVELVEPRNWKKNPYKNTRPNVIDILEERGLLDTVTRDSLKLVHPNLNSELKVYCGFDPNAPSLVGIIILSWFLRCGHRAVALIDGSMCRIGDPSAKNTSDTIRQILVRPRTPSVCDIAAGNLQVLNSYDWWKYVMYLDFLREVGRYAMIENISFAEFSYQVLQAYDFVYLYDKEGVSVQIGGSDQWGNITAGTDLVGKLLGKSSDVEAFGLTFPLLLKSDGTKFGKSEDGAIWLSPSLLSPYKFYQYFFSVPDDDVVRFFKILTFLSLEEIAELEKDMGKPGYVPNTVQRRLAEEVTKFVHGPEGLEEALKATEALEHGNAGSKLDLNTVEGIAELEAGKCMNLSKSTRPNVIDILEERGLLKEMTCQSLRSVCSNPNLAPLKVYCGFDPTAESLHLGNLLGIIVLAWFLRCGHRVVALIGGATGRIGDPSGKSIERPELDVVSIERNCSGISDSIWQILLRLQSVCDVTRDVQILNNYDWWKDVRARDFLLDVGRYFRLGTMMSKECVRRRLENVKKRFENAEQGMSYAELAYPLLQGYDFVHLNEKEGVGVQIGGSDQWGNITGDIDFIPRLIGKSSNGGSSGSVSVVFRLTCPLLLIKSDGTKFGKSEHGAIWLSPTLLFPYKCYQYFFSVPDDDVVRFLTIFTFLSMEEIAELESDMGKPGYIPNTAQRTLAEEVTKFVHGPEGLEEALKATEALNPGNADIKLDWKTIEGIAADVPSCSMPYDQVLNLPFLDLFVSSGLLESKSAGRRMLKQGGLYLNNARVDSEAKKIAADDIIDDKVILLSAGKKNKMVVRIS